MWFESVLRVGDEPVGLSVPCLDDDERDRTVATLAWLTLEIVTAVVKATEVMIAKPGDVSFGGASVYVG